jgi:hypothetical protein
MRTKHAARFLSWFLLACSAHASYAQDVNGDLNTNIGAGSNVDSNNVNNTNSTVNNGGQGVMGNPVPTAMAPTVMGGGGNDSCLIPSSTGFQISLFGVAQGRMEQDPECNRRKDSRLLGAPQTVGGLGLQVAGISRMCGDPMVFRAMALANTVCPIMNVNTGRLLIGRDAVEMYRENPEILIVGYADDKLFWDTLFKIGEALDEIPSTSNTLSLSDRFRSRGRPDDNRAGQNSERGDGSGSALTDTGDGR